MKGILQQQKWDKWRIHDLMTLILISWGDIVYNRNEQTHH
jgi:hypothetical protein